ncbi:13070_t:CDS:2 [Ambispora leptoticha]|uniref:13070_t:CDS:1 n=1 Tax=Ambispora leptoticha TaxID=144679 RepID=A0A9N9B0R2_9GLOM|nr:13070_t:CDS:2 [Ambispora leptoticha]
MASVLLLYQCDSSVYETFLVSSTTLLRNKPISEKYDTLIS